MWRDTRLTDLLGVKHPIIQAPMAGATTLDMALAAGQAGALGSLGTAMAAPDTVKELGSKVAQSTNLPINFNFFCHKDPKPNAVLSAEFSQSLQEYYTEFGLGDVPSAEPSNFPFDQRMCDAVLAANPKIVSFHFGLPELVLMKALKSAGIIILSSATTVDEAKWLEANGADAIIAQGWEAGGHRGFFLTPDDKKVGLMALVPAIVDAVSVPVVAAGGISDGRGIAAALALGASGVQIGTALLNSPESSIPDAHKMALLASDGSDTRTTRVFSGRPARGIENRYMNEVEKAGHSLPEFPILNTLTGPLRKVSAAQGKPDFVSLWSGQGVSQNRALGVQQIIEAMVDDAQRVMDRG